MFIHYRRRLGLGLAALLLSAGAAHGQGASPVEFSLGYSYVHSNAPPAGCGCFSMNGGTGDFAALLGHDFSAVAQAGGYFQNNVHNSGRSLRVETFLFGPRYSSAHWKRWTPYAQVLFGGSLGSGTLYGPNATTSGTASGFSMSAGGGMDFKVSPHVSIRLFQVDYLMTQLPNAVNNVQNNLRVTAGVVFRLGRPPSHR
jgi:outer membrane immunogenic protein